MKRDTKICLQHIYDRSDRILTISQFVSYDQFKKNFILHDAVIRSFEVIGEAAHGLSKQYQAQHPDIPFRQYGQLRNFLIHEYFAVDLRRIWMIVHKDLEKFHDQIGALLGVK